MTVESVSLGLHDAIVTLRDDWVRSFDIKSGEEPLRLPRAIIMEEGSDTAALNWIQYVRFGL